MDKRGQGLSTTTIIIIILGVLVLVVIIIGFTMGWDKIAPWVSPSNNVDDLKQACQLACSQESEYNFCNVKRELRIEEKIGNLEDKGEYTCDELSKGTLGIASCAAIDCSKTCEELGGEWVEGDGCPAVSDTAGTLREDLTDDANDKATNTDKLCCEKVA